MTRVVTPLVFVLLLIITGCETRKIIFVGPYFVRFTDATGFTKESDRDTVSLQLHNGGPALEEDVVVHYKLTGDAREGIDYRIIGESGTATIPASSYFGYIKLLMINNSNNILGKQDIVITLQSLNVSTRKIGEGESSIGRSYTFTIFDDCVLGGVYDGKSGNVTVGGILITSTDCENYTLSNFNINIDPSIYPYTDALDLVFIDNADNTLTIPSQIESSFDTGKQHISGSGTVDPLTGVITMTVDFDDYPGESEHFTLKPHVP